MKWIYSAAIWRERGSAYIRIIAVVLLSFGNAAGLYATGDSLGGNLFSRFVVAAAGLLLLRLVILDATRLHAGLVSAPAELQRRPASPASADGVRSGATGGFGVPCPQCRRPASVSAHYCAGCGVPLKLCQEWAEQPMRAVHSAP